MLWISVTCLIVAVLGLTSAKPPASLRMVHYLFRHGDRSPMRTYKGDPNPVDTTWTKGFGQLTTTGMQQHYKLGRYFRQRYDGFISGTYYNKEVYVRATDVDRTLMSAYSHLAGLYPPQGEDVWNTSFPWQPIPVHTIPEALDFVLRCDDCPKQNVLREKVYEMPYFQNIQDQYSGFMEWISALVDTKYDIRNIYQLTDTIFIENLKKLPLPKFVNDSVVDRLMYLEMINFKTQAYTPELQRITGGGGPLVNEITERIKLKIDGKLDPDLKLYIYSAHDSTVSAFLHSIQSFNDMGPPYTATVIMELHEIEEQYYLQFSYKNESSREAYDLVIPGCSFRCPFQKFVELTKAVISPDVKKECQIHGILPEQDDQKIQVIIFASIAGVSVMIVLLQVAVISLLSRRNKRIMYSRVDLNM